jgi:undecaprenyl diphosphate synthase
VLRMIDGSGGLGGIGSLRTFGYSARSRIPGHEGRRRLDRDNRPFTEIGAGRGAKPVFPEKMQHLASHRLPEHVAIIMDGNGRWAAARGGARPDGHRQGAEAVRRVVRAARELGIPCLTLYAFSAQNWQRPPAEVADLMRLLHRFIVDERAELTARGIRLTTIGDERRLPAFVRGPLAALVEATHASRGMTLCLALSYGGRESIVRAAQRIARAAVAGRVRPEAIGEDDVSAALDTRALPAPDLIIRTSGEQRLSNFMLWEAAYAELYFTEAMWPDFDRAHLEEALAVYGRRERRFGRVTESVA